MTKEIMVKTVKEVVAIIKCCATEWDCPDKKIHEIARFTNEKEMIKFLDEKYPNRANDEEWYQGDWYTYHYWIDYEEIK
jgi:hypothetical protein